MKVVFSTGAEAPITKVSSIYSLGISSTDEEDIKNFKDLLTPENLKSFSLVDDEGNMETRTAKNFVFSQIISGNNDVDNEEVNYTNFILRPMTQEEIRIMELETENAILNDAIAELAALISE